MVNIKSSLLVLGTLVFSLLWAQPCPWKIAEAPGFALENSLNGENFILPSGNIACNLWENNSLRCDIRSGLNPPPKSTCALDWTGISLGKSQKARPTCAGDTVFGSHPVLNYGGTWSRAGMKCTATTSGLTCKSPSGHGFFLSRGQWRTY